MTSDPQRATEASAAVVRLRAVVIHEDTPEAAIAEKRAAEFSHLRGCFQPARRLRIEISQRLQVAVLLLGQKLDAHGGRHVRGAVLRLEFLPGIQGLTVVANTRAAFGAF